MDDDNGSRAAAEMPIVAWIRNHPWLCVGIILIVLGLLLILVAKGLRDCSADNQPTALPAQVFLPPSPSATLARRAEQDRSEAPRRRPIDFTVIVQTNTLGLKDGGRYLVKVAPETL